MEDIWQAALCGNSVEAAYQPACETGGDTYQIQQRPGGAPPQSLRDSSAALIDDLKRALVELGGRFVTCPATAGQPAPCMDGVEWVTEGWLPLAVPQEAVEAANVQSDDLTAVTVRRAPVT